MARLASARPSHVAARYIAQSQIVATSARSSAVVAKQLERAERLSRSRASELAGSANYMGSKRELAGFLAEAMSVFLPPDGVIVDLMCGAGAAAKGFAEFWDTVASDAQEFCRALAVVQGGGFSANRARALANRILTEAAENADALTEALAPVVEREDRLLHGDVGPHLLAAYQVFAREVSSFPAPGWFGLWEPATEVDARRADRTLFPYCLFTAYFASTFFGLRQCIEIDSLRYGIEQLADPADRKWALGALVATVSAVGTTYAGHFAQPRSPDESTLPGVLSRQSQSVTHEFRMRLEALGRESEGGRRPIRDVPGPWPEALDALQSELQGAQVAVYVDAPYKREEYSRYYHVLETVVTYAYPSLVGLGRMPDKRMGERFRSEFFTRSRPLVEANLAAVILEVLRRDWMCAWSYSSDGAADIVSVIERVRSVAACRVLSYATWHRYNSQGKSLEPEQKRRAKTVTEYLVIFLPEGWPSASADPRQRLRPCCASRRESVGTHRPPAADVSRAYHGR